MHKMVPKQSTTAEKYPGTNVSPAPCAEVEKPWTRETLQDLFLALFLTAHLALWQLGEEVLTISQPNSIR